MLWRWMFRSDVRIVNHVVKETAVLVIQKLNREVRSGQQKEKNSHQVLTDMFVCCKSRAGSFGLPISLNQFYLILGY